MYCRSLEVKKKLSLLKIGKPSGNKGKRYKWVTNGVISKFISFTDTIPYGWNPGRIKP